MDILFLSIFLFKIRQELNSLPSNLSFSQAIFNDILNVKYRTTFIESSVFENTPNGEFCDQPQNKL